MSAGVHLGLGSNVGDRMENLRMSVERLSQRVRVVQASSVYETEPVGFEGQSLFLNAVVSTTDELGPFELLDWAKQIERDLGRAPSFRNAPRPIDIDILLYGEMVVRTAALTVPHSHMAERAFVLVPLAEIAGDTVEPVTRQKISGLLASVGGVGGVRQVRGLRLEPTAGWQRRTDV